MKILERPQRRPEAGPSQRLAGIPNGIDKARMRYDNAADLRAPFVNISRAALLTRLILGQSRLLDPVDGELPRTQASVDLMRGSDESSIGMSLTDSRRIGIIDSCRAAMDVIRNGGECMQSGEQDGEQCIRVSAALLAIEAMERGSPVVINTPPQVA